MEPKGRLGQVISVRVNCSGTKISILRESEDSRDADARLLVYDVESETTSEYDFGSGIPENHCWDAEDPRLLACEARSTDTRVAEVHTLFSTQERGVLLQERLPLGHGEGLLSMHAPFLSFFLAPSASPDSSRCAPDRARGAHLAEIARGPPEGALARSPDNHRDTLAVRAAHTGSAGRSCATSRAWRLWMRPPGRRSWTFRTRSPPAAWRTRSAR